MPEDRSLDDFAEANESGDAEPATTEPGGDAGAAGPEPDSDDSGGPDGDSAASNADPDDAVEPAVETSTWHADGAACDRCGERVDRRWRDDDALVCTDCVSW